MMQQIKIIPVFVFVAMLAFSVRMVEVVNGVSSLSGAAFAKSEEAKAPEEPSIQFEDKNESDDKEMKDSHMAEPVESPEWRDAIDENPGYDEIRVEMFEDLAKRRQELQKTENALHAREALLQAAEQELSRKYQELSRLKQEIEKLLGQQSEAEKKRLGSLVKIYEGMKSKDAARIFDTLDLDILVSVVSEMSERKLSPILASMNPERARTITIMLAEQKKLPSMP